MPPPASTSIHEPLPTSTPSRGRLLTGLILQIVGVVMPFTAGFAVGLGFSVGGTTGWIAFSAIVAAGGIMWWAGARLRPTAHLATGDSFAHSVDPDLPR